MAAVGPPPPPIAARVGAPLAVFQQQQERTRRAVRDTTAAVRAGTATVTQAIADAATRGELTGALENCKHELMLNNFGYVAKWGAIGGSQESRACLGKMPQWKSTLSRSSSFGPTKSGRGDPGPDVLYSAKEPTELAPAPAVALRALRPRLWHRSRLPDDGLRGRRFWAAARCSAPAVHSRRCSSRAAAHHHTAVHVH